MIGLVLVGFLVVLLALLVLVNLFPRNNATTALYVEKEALEEVISTEIRYLQYLKTLESSKNVSKAAGDAFFFFFFFLYIFLGASAH
jgi:hypothetical protein